MYTIPRWGFASQLCTNLEVDDYCSHRLFHHTRNLSFVQKSNHHSTNNLNQSNQVPSTDHNHNHPTPLSPPTQPKASTATTPSDITKLRNQLQGSQSSLAAHQGIRELEGYVG